MKILIPHTVGNSALSNPFVRTLRDGLIACGHEVVCGKELFWDSSMEYDLVFFQWPESILNKEKTAPDLEHIKTKVKQIKNQGIPIAITCHNLHPHDANLYLEEVYDYLYSQMDIFHHMGEYSMEKMKKKYPSAYHFVAPHPAFYTISEKELNSSEKYKDKYGLSKNKIVIMAFGAFRNSEERDMFSNLANKFKGNFIFWAPKIYRDTYRKKSFLTRAACIGRYLKYSLIGLKMSKSVPNDEEVMPMICASDILFIQRKEILNSGNLPLGFSAGKIVVGPDKGNVGEILKKTGNIVFNPNDETSIVDAISKAVKMFKDGNRKGYSNYEYAKNNLQPLLVIKQISETLEKYMQK